MKRFEKDIRCYVKIREIVNKYIETKRKKEINYKQNIEIESAKTRLEDKFDDRENIDSKMDRSGFGCMEERVRKVE